MLAENDLPRTDQQIARELNSSLPTILNSLASLQKEGYIQPGKLPQPGKVGETAKPRIRTAEEETMSWLRAQEARKRYDKSERGQIAHWIYETSPKGKEKNKRYWADRGKLIQRAFRLRRNIASMKVIGKDTSQEEALLREVEKEL
jgi:hypothetical protein